MCPGPAPFVSLEGTALKIGKVFGFLRRRGWLLVVGVALGVIVSVLLTQQTLSTYEAKATVAVANKTQIPGTTDYVDQPLSRQMANTYAQLITRPIILDEVQKRLNIKSDRNLLLKKITAAAVSAPEGSVSSVSGVRNDPQQIEIKVRDTDPSFAANLANTLAQVFIEDNAGQFVAPGSLRLVEGALVPKTPVRRPHDDQRHRRRRHRLLSSAVARPGLGVRGRPRPGQRGRRREAGPACTRRRRQVQERLQHPGGGTRLPSRHLLPPATQQPAFPHLHRRPQGAGPHQRQR